MIRIYLYGHLKICFLTQRPPHYPRQSHGVVAEVVRNDLPLAARFEIASEPLKVQVTGDLYIQSFNTLKGIN